MTRPAVILMVLASLICTGCSGSAPPGDGPSSGEPAVVAQPELAPRERRAESWRTGPTDWETLLEARVRKLLDKPVTIEQLRVALEAIPDIAWTVQEQPSFHNEPQIRLTLLTPYQKGYEGGYCPYHLLLRWAPSSRQITEYSFLVDFN
ncbi:MAG: hypothetical protein GXY74_10715 [Phycisphaerae bacterium]|nr:hypothetical protein [Phycisphaerae bacterium]